MNALRDFFTPGAGQARTNWLNNVLQTYVADPMNYYLGPTGVPGKVQAAGNALEFTDAGDMPAAADAGRRLWNDPSIGNAAEYAAAGIALGLPLYSARLGEGIADLADELVRGYDPDTLNAFRVWHGSPHDFDRFSMDKIGTGEGAQAYGHGLYFAENRGVAEGYRDTLANRKYMPGDSAGPVKSAWSLVGGSADRAAMPTDELLPYVKNAWPNVPDDELRAAIEEAKSAFSPGRLYEVAIDADPEDFLDWDAPLSAQPSGQRLMSDFETRRQRILAGLPEIDGSMSATDYDAQYGDALSEAARLRIKPEWTGAQFYESSRLVPGDFRDPVAASEALREAGIPGIRYLDAGSRGAGDGSRNYVLFDDSLATILSKNGERTNTAEAERMRAELAAFLSENGY